MGEQAEAIVTLESQVNDLEDETVTQAEELEVLTTLLAGVSPGAVAGRDTLTLPGKNVQIDDGTGTTDGAPNGLGNLIIGYAKQRDWAATRVGSHHLVFGDLREWTRSGGLVAGLDNNTIGDRSSVFGGSSKTASGG